MRECSEPHPYPHERQHLQTRRFSNFPLLCNTTDLVQQSFEAWKDTEVEVQMPVTMATVEKAIEIGLKVVKDRRKREADNIQRSECSETR